MANEKRLIDANALKRIIQETIAESDFELFKQVMREMCDILDKSPTEDAAEVVHGRWIAVPSSDMNIGHAFKCSECNKMRFGSHIPNYCPNCGADMRERKDNAGTPRDRLD